MKKIYSSLRSFCFLFAMIVGVSAFAGDLGELQLDKTYKIKGDFQTWEAHFTPSTSGQLSVTSTAGLSLEPYTSNDFSLSATDEDGNFYCPYRMAYEGNFVAGQGFVYSIDVEAGHTYYFYTDFSMNDTDFMISQGQDVALNDISLSDGDILSCSGYGNVEMTFNIPVVADAVTLTIGDKKIDLTDVTRFDGYYIVVVVKNTLLDLLKSNPELGNNPCTLTITGLRSKSDEKNVYGEDGTLSLNYILGALPAELVSDNSQGFHIYSYFAPNSEQGKLVLNFSQELDPTSGSADLVFGNPEGEVGECYQEYLPVVTQGTTVTVDFTGKLRRLQDMVKSGTNYGGMTVMVTGIKCADGQYVFSDGEGTLGSFTYYLPYSEISLNLACEFNPAAGSQLNDVDNIEIYVNDGSNIAFDGVIFSWEGNEEGTVIAKEDLKIETDSYGGITINVAVPEAAKTASNVLVALYNLTTNDGIDHSKDISALYNAFVITSITPADGSKLYALEEGSTITVNTNMNDQIGHFVYQIVDTTTGAVVKTEDVLTKQENGSWAAEMLQNYRLIKFHTYEVSFTAYANEADTHNGVGALGNASVYYEGLTEPFKFSDVKFNEAVPAPGFTITSENDNEFTLYFDGLVKIDDSKSFINLGYDVDTQTTSTAPFESITAPEMEDGYANTWIFVVAKEIILEENRTDLDLCIKAYDMNGVLVEGNEGDEENSYIHLTYNVSIAAAPVGDIVITPAEGKVDSLKDFDIVFNQYKDMGIEWNTSAPITLYRNNEEVAKLKNDYVEIVFIDWGLPINEVKFSFSQEFVEDGSYELVIPEKFFTVNDGSSWTPEFRFTYAIGTSGIDSILGGRPEAYKVYDLSGKHVITTTDANALSNFRGIFIINGVKTLLR